MAFRDENPTFGVVRFEPTQQPDTRSFLNGSFWYDYAAQQFKGIVNGSVVAVGTGGGGAVSSVFGRTGVVVSATNDYNFNQLAGSIALAQTPLTTNSDLFTVAGGALARLATGSGTQVLHGGNTWGQVSLSADVTGNLAVGNLNSGTSASSSTFWRGDGTWATPAGSGTVNAAQQFATAYYSAAGSASTISGIVGPTTPNGVPQTLISTPSAGVATAPAWSLSGVPTNAQTGTSYTIAVTDRASFLTFSNASAIAVTLPQAGTAGFGSNFICVACTIGAGTATITPTPTSTISYTNGSAYTSAAANLPLTTGQCAWIYSDNTNYFAILRSGSAGGATAWSAITNPAGNLALTMGSNTSTFNYATALANAWTWANNTAATVTTPQSSPSIFVAGTEWTGAGASTVGSIQAQFTPAVGLNALSLGTFTLNSSSTNANNGWLFNGQIYSNGGSFNSFNIGAPGARGASFSGGGLNCASGTRCVSFSNSGNIDAGGIDGNISRLAANLMAVGNGTAQDQTGLLVTGNTQRQTGSSYTNATTTPSTFKTWTLPALAQNYSFSCKLIYQGSASTAGLALSVNSSVAPTSLMAHARIFTTLTGTSTDATVTTTSSGNVAVLSGAAPNATATNYEAYIDGTIEEPGAGGTFAIQAAATGVGTLTILRGSFCQLY